ncbi:hypothetical protein FBU59_001101 [Linderina macrospora]|uniref:Uncharacterized protein n=1 Tax=Linderina macrospora TaxID=4868 RepID=A0ACC1JEY6_9FUNG|nr:hypothetical protein FBU59_001101 [Linderina macrospora]
MTNQSNKRTSDDISNEWINSGVSPAKRRTKTNAKPSQGTQNQTTQPPPSNNFSPVVARTGTGRTTANLSSNAKSETTSRRNEAKNIRSKDFREDIPDLVNVAKPRTPSVQKAATTIIENAAKSIKKTVARRPKRNTTNYIREWTEWNTTASRDEHKLEPMFDEFVKVVAQHVKQYFAAHPDSLSAPKGWSPRLLLPSANHDFKPFDSDTKVRIDGALGFTDVDSDVHSMDLKGYAAVLAVLELKWHRSRTNEAYDQNIDYTRNIFACQHSRRFGWGLTGCGSEVRAMLYLPDFVLASTAMELSTDAGRRAFVKFLVYWSLCEEDQLGYDPTIRRAEGGGCYEIDCYDREEQTITKMYSNTLVLSASRVLGRHTRCYVAFPTIEDATSEPTDFTSKEARVIKDAWAQSATDDSKSDDRNEVMHLDHVRDIFNGKDLGFPYVMSDACGDVMLRSGDGFWVDSTKTILSALSDESRKMCLAEDQAKLPNRIHRRLCMTPVGEPLRTLKSEAELVRVLLDAMRCHMALVNDCKLLHRDISDNNILVVRQSGVARGLLIDLDNAVRLDVDRGDGRRVRTGTLPFMSLNNLRGVEHECTALDDWESFLYLICWLATFGINRDDRTSEKDSQDFAINNWRYGSSIEMIACTKADHMHSADSFKVHILENFKEEYELLKDLARELHSALFLHESCKGAVQTKDEVVAGLFTRKRTVVKGKDPLTERMAFKEDILSSLRGLVDDVDEYLTNPQ